MASDGDEEAEAAKERQLRRERSIEVAPPRVCLRAPNPNVPKLQIRQGTQTRQTMDFKVRMYIIQRYELLMGSVIRYTRRIVPREMLSEDDTRVGIRRSITRVQTRYN